MKCYFTAVVSYFCKRFANQNAMYSRYGLYFRFTALQTVCKYDQLNKGKEMTEFALSVHVNKTRLQLQQNDSYCPSQGIRPTAEQHFIN